MARAAHRKNRYQSNFRLERGGFTTGQVCYLETLSGDAFPNTEVFVANSEGQATTLLNFATTCGQNAGPWTLLSPTVVPMGTFFNICVP